MELENEWVLISGAPERVNRSRATIYRWVQEGRVATMRPMRALWLSVPDLLKAERDTRGQGLR